LSDLPRELVEALVRFLLQQLHASAQIENRLARFAVGEELRLRGREQARQHGEGYGDDERARGHHGYTRSTRRFSAYDASSVPVARGRSSPKLTASICMSGTPSAVIARRTASARFCPSARLYSRLPLSSVFPWSTTRRVGFASR